MTRRSKSRRQDEGFHFRLTPKAVITIADELCYWGCVPPELMNRTSRACINNPESEDCSVKTDWSPEISKAFGEIQQILRAQFARCGGLIEYSKAVETKDVEKIRGEYYDHPDIVKKRADDDALDAARQPKQAALTLDRLNLGVERNPRNA